MKCPIDQTEMKHGFLGVGTWREAPEGSKPLTSITWPWVRKNFLMKASAYRCPRCGKIEITSEPGK